MTADNETNLHVAYSKCTNTNTGLESVLTELTNTGTFALEAVEVEFTYDFETPQDATEDVRQAVPELNISAASETGGSYALNPQGDGPLEPGETRAFVLPSAWLEKIKSLIQSLSPERYRLAIKVNGEEDGSLPGATFGEFIEREFSGS